MSDFGELCPLFNTGVFNEVTFPDIKMTNVTACGNALIGTLTCASATRTAVWTFGRTVVVTGGFLRQRASVAIANTAVARLMHHTTMLAAGTEFATLAIQNTSSGFELGYTWMPFTTVTDKTFTSSEVLGFTMLTGTNASGGTFDLIVRYREK